ncbi:MAG TPA: NAD-dependent epimerase/dehydratase family protein [Bacteroidia bacterium]|nr:NAD-dependent epimerase/dehydratase family protein [Bacteroidia bacterium]HNT79245.1 NAD-dependent epimerase/dehydratase family protein [Bacteroidia bacterium]
MKSNIKILVTGGAGFIGSSLAEKLSENPDNYIVIVDNLQTGSLSKVPKSLYGNIKFIKADVNDYKDVSSIFHAYAFDYVFHYAATVGVKRTLDHPVQVLNDLLGIKNILNLSKNTGVKRIYFSSSSEVYGEPVEYPQNEHTTPLNSRLPYAIVKNVGEAYLRAYKQEYNLDFTIFRFFNTYGPKQSTDFVMSKFIAAALKDEDITIFGDGSQTRTFCFIDDNIEATLKSFYNNMYVNDVVNIGSDCEMSILELATHIIEKTSSKSRIVHVEALPEGDMTRRRPDIAKMKSLLNSELITLNQGIEHLISKRHWINA